MSLKHVEARIVVEVFMDEKESHTFADGTKIELRRKYDNFDRKFTEVSQGKVISGDGIPEGAILLFHHNGTHASNEIFNYKQISGADIAKDVRYFSIPESQCFLWSLDKVNWTPIKGWTTGLRVFKPYKGILTGIDPTQIKETLYITDGEYTGKVVHTVRASDYTIIFQGASGQEEQIIRLRHFEGEDNPREEILCVNHNLTEQVNSGQLYVGLTISDAKPISYVSS